MKTMKVMGIIGLVLAVLAFICMVAWNNYIDYSYAIGWGVWVVLYLIAYSIVGIVQAKRQDK